MDKELKKRIAGLIDRLIFPDFQSAINELVKIGEPAVPALIRALEHEFHEVRYNSAKALGEIGDPSAVPSLVRSLDDCYGIVQRHSMEALGKIGAISAVPALIERLDDDNFDFRTYAQDALVAIVPPAVPGLIAGLEDKRYMVQFGSAQALGRIGGALLRGDASKQAENSAEFYMTTIPVLIGRMMDHGCLTYHAAADALAAMGRPAVPALIAAMEEKSSEMKDEFTDMRYNAANVLGRIGEESAVPALIQALGADTQSLQNNARDALAAIGKPAIPPLIKALGCGSETARWNCFRALLNIIDGGADIRLEDLRSWLLETISLHGRSDPTLAERSAVIYSNAAEAVRNRKSRLLESGLNGIKLKPPKGDKGGVFRSGSRLQFA